MKRVLPIIIAAALLIPLAAACGVWAATGQSDLVDRITLRSWNGQYYCNVVFPDGSRQELKDGNDLTYGQWQAKIRTAWEAHQAAVPPVEPVLTAATVDEIKAEVARRRLTAADLGLTVTR